MKKIHSAKWLRRMAAVLAAAMLCVSLSGCNIITLVQNWGAVGEETIESQYGDYSLTVTSGWVDATGLLDPSAVLEVADKVREKYVVVLLYTWDEVVEDMTLEEFSDYVSKYYSENIDNGRRTSEPDATVEGKSAPSYQVTGSVDGLDLTYWITCSEAEEGYFQTIGWTLKNMANKNKDDIQTVMHSLKVG